MSVLADRTLTCRDCGSQFTFTVGEQQFFQSKGLVHEPGRCPSCRALRRDGGGGRGASGGGMSGGGRQMYTVTCAGCGTETQVPFQPTQGRPVYCRDCFQQTRSR